MSRKNVIEMKLDALADYLGVDFAVRDNQAMCIKNKNYRAKLSDTDVVKIVETLWDDKRFQDEFENHIDLLKQYLQKKLSRQIKFTVEDRAKLAAISEIMKADYYEKLRKMEEE